MLAVGKFYENEKGEVIIPLLFFLDFLVHGASVILADIVGHHQHFHRNGAGAHGDLQLVANLHIIAGFHHTAVDADAAMVAGFIGNGAAFDQPGDLQILI